MPFGTKPLLAGIALLALGACNSGGGDDAADELGSTFERAFNAEMNAEPLNPQPGDLTVNIGGDGAGVATP